MILQKHTSKFVAGLFNSLGITACVALTSCSGENNVKQTENQVENLKNGLKTVDFYKSLAEDEGSLKTIADWLNSKNYGSDYILTAKDLQEIFNNNPDKLNEVAEKLGVELTESDPNRDDENQKGGITLKIDSETTDFVFDTIEDFQKFGKVLVDALPEKKNIQVEGEWSLIFEKDKVKICGHKVGFDYIQNLRTFLESLQNVIKFNKFQVPKLSLKIENGKLSLNEVECKDEYYKGQEFWSLVNEYLAFFEIVGGKFEIEKNEKANVENGGSDVDTVTINGFESSLPWKWVVNEESNTLVDNPGWGNIFKIKGKEESVKEVTVEFENGKCTCDEIGAYKDGVELKDLATLGKLVEDLNDKKVKVADSKKFSLAFEDKTVKVCGHSKGFEVMKESDFEQLLKCVAALKGEGKAISSTFKIALTMNSAKVLFDGKEINSDFVKTAEFWNTVKGNIGLFGISEEKIKVEKNGSADQCKINGSLVVTDLKFSDVCREEASVVAGYDQIFSLPATKQE